MRKLFFILSFICSLYARGQNFNYLYGGSTEDWGIDVIETYDNGYVILSTLDGQYARMMLTKVDVNVVVLWRKVIGAVSNKIAPSCIIQTTDNGFLLTGEEYKYDPPPAGGNSFAMKLNECGEIEWTKSYGSFGNMDYITKAVQTDDKGFAMLANYIDNNRIVLLKIDSVGHLEFKKHYFDTSGSTGWPLIKCMNGDLLFSGYGYFQNPGGLPAGWWVRSLVCRVDKNGNEKWNYIVGLDTIFMTLSMQCTEMPDSSIICGTTYRDAIHNQKALMLKLSKDGDLIWKKFVGDTAWFNSDVNGITLMDSSKVYIMSGRDYNPVYHGVFLYKADSSGLFIDTAWYDSDHYCWTGNLKAVSNHKLIYCGTQDNGGNYQAQIIRFREDLSIDTVLNIQLTYDSLCGHVIPAIEYLPFDTNYHVGVSDVNIQPKEMKIFPNPASNEITLKLDKPFEKDAIVTVFNSIGEQVIKQKVYKTDSDVMIDIARLQAGIYIVRVSDAATPANAVGQGCRIHTGKFVKE